MENNKVINIKNKLFKSKNFDYSDCKIYTPEMVKKYKECFKFTMKVTKNHDKTLFIMYKKVEQWYRNENINWNMEKIHIKTKLGSYTSGGCGIEASLLAGLTASGVCTYMDTYMKKLSPLSLAIYAVAVLFFGMKVLADEDKTVEMYNMFLDVINELEEKNYSRK
ncbi:hypothetical protein LJE39_08675 [Clostridium butyricum]|uniref:hypothetical protein n=1 Tax=Clostridium TaxID=1485 RepID=UPI0021C3BEC7|nr:MULTISPECIES: hypothetical protein [Clostridium]MCQ2013233.1 hypothetical protein [Clostridium butyricum]MDU4587235.1 hypothetical protein [Clostridium sp.]